MNTAWKQWKSQQWKLNIWRIHSRTNRQLLPLEFPKKQQRNWLLVCSVSSPGFHLFHWSSHVRILWFLPVRGVSDPPWQELRYGHSWSIGNTPCAIRPHIPNHLLQRSYSWISTRSWISIRKRRHCATSLSHMHGINGGLAGRDQEYARRLDCSVLYGKHACILITCLRNQINKYLPGLNNTRRLQQRTILEVPRPRLRDFQSPWLFHHRRQPGRRKRKRKRKRKTRRKRTYGTRSRNRQKPNPLRILAPTTHRLSLPIILRQTSTYPKRLVEGEFSRSHDYGCR